MTQNKVYAPKDKFAFLKPQVGVQNNFKEFFERKDFIACEAA